MDWELILEAERRGILPPDKAELLAEARRRGLVPGDVQAAPTTRRIQPEVQAQRDQGRLDILQSEREQIQQRAQTGDQRAAEDLQAIDREIARTSPAAARAVPAAAPAPAPAPTARRPPVSQLSNEELLRRLEGK